MSASESQPARAHDEEANASIALGHDGLKRRALAQGQAHDRITRAGGNIDGGGSADSRGRDEVSITAGQRMLSATSGSLLTSLLVTPLDVVRVRLQSQPPLSSLQSNMSTTASSSSLPSSTASFSKLPPNLGVTACCREVFWMNNNALCLAGPNISPSTITTTLPAGACAAEETQRRNFTSTFDALRKIARNEGPSTLWRGLSPTLAMAIPANVIYFTGYDWLRYSTSSPLLKSTFISHTYLPLVAGAVARTLAATAIAPIELFRTRLQATTTDIGSTVQLSTKNLYIRTARDLQSLVLRDGSTALWRGLTLTLWRDVPFSAIYWWGYESLFNRLHRSDPSEDPRHSSTFSASFAAGFISGAIASILTMPFDVGKTRRQTAISGSKSVAVEQEAHMLQFLARIVREEGIGGLWRGWVARTLKVAPACAIMISSYEVGKVIARKRNNIDRDEVEV